MEQSKKYIKVQSQRGNFKVESDILDTLTLPETWILWQKSAAEYIFFSKEKWDFFVEEMKRKSGMTPIQLQYSAQWRDFIRELSSKWTSIITTENMLHIERGGLKKNISEGKSRVEICI
ncbi:MAG: hypothetical protein ACD_80C00019G0002 [uncultured bacterium (gcode 4)]|uniref:Uncharacterized protein n=1 Tax=uncultured bacterium (gcode 4) TaxID=1234023 RepID=K1X5R1_9BACT|nr:MAG: hypothetical protein ACD_80C00019G0002 [uncultured bacterium (gcode 4)]